MQSLDRVVEYRHADPPSDIAWKNSDQKKSKPMTKRQRLVVEECLTSDQTFDQVMTKHHITVERFAEWLKQGTFRNYLRRIRKSLAEQRKMIVAIGAVRGARFLQLTANFAPASPKEDRERTARCKAAMTLLRHADAIESEEHNHRRRGSEPAERVIAHPDLSPEESLRMLQMLEGKQASD